MDVELTAIEFARLERTAIEAVRKRMAEQQRGELFTNLDKVKDLPENPPN